MMKTGVVTSLNGNEGIISYNDESLVFKLLGDNNSIKNGDNVEFSIVDLGRRKLATNVKRIERPQRISPSNQIVSNSIPTKTAIGSKILRFYLPDKFLATKYSSFKGLDIYQIPQWLITSSSDISIDMARQNIIERAEYLGANGLINLTYSRSIGQSGNYRYSIHHFSANPVILIKPHRNGTYTPDYLVDLEHSLEEQNQILFESKNSIFRRNVIISLLLVLLSAIGYLAEWFAIPVISFVAAIFLWIAYWNFDHWTIRL
jgi:hypothetical protein